MSAGSTSADRDESIERSSATALLDEIDGADFTRRMLASLVAVAGDGLGEYEARNTLERYLLSVAQAWGSSGARGGLHAYAIDPAHADQTRAAREKFVAELQEKGIAGSPRVAAEVFNGLAALIRDTTASAERVLDLRTTRDACPSLVVANERAQFSILVTPRMKAMFALATARGLSHEDAVRAVAAVCMRYASVLAGPQHWGMPQEEFDRMYDVLGVRFEGFASPLNSRAVIWAARGGDARFCSLFPDVDGVFGSLGSFFDVDLLDPLGAGGAPGAAWEINPPFIESLLEEVTGRVLAAARRAGGRFLAVMLYPKWDDSAAVVPLLELNTEPGELAGDAPEVRVRLLPKDTYFLEVPDGRKIGARFASYYISVCSEALPAEEVELLEDVLSASRSQDTRPRRERGR